ncbi:hypothetical protein C8J57DRAFT_1535302 [Mycena rebaudengoi]|nr:hypothetical protein C8J57DRAFT_1535302 [Mycena rebaudengoi]
MARPRDPQPTPLTAVLLARPPVPLYAITAAARACIRKRLVGGAPPIYATTRTRPYCVFLLLRFGPRVWVWIALPATQQASLPATLSGSVRPCPQNAFFPGVKPRFARNANTVRRAAGAFTERRQSAKLSRLRRRAAHANGLSRSSGSFASGWIRLPADNSQLTTDPVPTAARADSGCPAAQGTRHEDLISGGLAPVSADGEDYP